VSPQVDHDDVVVPDVNHTVPDIGARARDREADDGGALLVVDVFPRTAAANHVINGHRTVADHNPDYDPSAPVVECVYTDDLDDVDAGQDIDALRGCAEFRNLRTYHFPTDRLDVLDGEQGGGRQ